MFDRVLDLDPLLRHRSLFLFGARQTGKSTLLHQRFPDAVFFDLLEADTFRELSLRPEYVLANPARKCAPSGDRRGAKAPASKARVTRRDCSGLRALAEEMPLERKIVVCTEPRRRVEEGIEILPVEDFLVELWEGAAI